MRGFPSAFSATKKWAVPSGVLLSSAPALWRDPSVLPRLFGQLQFRLIDRLGAQRACVNRPSLKTLRQQVAADFVQASLGGEADAGQRGVGMLFQESGFALVLLHFIEE